MGAARGVDGDIVKREEATMFKTEIYMKGSVPITCID